MKLRASLAVAAVVLVGGVLVGTPVRAGAQAAGPTMLDPSLAVRTVVSGLTTPTSIAFLGPSDLLVLEKNTGRVLRVTNGVVQGVVLDLSVNFASERGLLGIALHPDFPANPGVYLYWSCRSTAPPTDPFFPDERRCLDANVSGPDTGDVLQVPLLGNRVDRFVWNGSTLAFDRNLVMLRSFQNDAAPQPPNQGDQAQPPRGNHDGGVLAFGPDRKLYVIFGDNGRRGQLQNLAQGPTPPTADDQFGGPEPDDAHLTGVVLRLNDDGSAPPDNPFFAAGAARGGEVGANLQKVFAYGVRNSFGMAFDPLSGNLWDQQNGDDTFDELNLVEPGTNGGWVQVMGPLSRLSQYKQIETTFGAQNLQQLRWSPTNIADTPAQALSRLFVLPGSHYSDPEFAWKWAVPPAAVGFVKGRGLGAQFEGDLFVGAATPLSVGGYLFHFNLTGNRRQVAVDDPRLEDRVADNNAKHDLTESESLLIGRDFGVTTDIQTGPNGNLFVVSVSNGAIYEISRAR
ncbi:MAG TPA: PQQ-dependent sugar dehydrogenase [Actinomycetota bacterium]|jgi:glucose/arabinose dehydrogenase